MPIRIAICDDDAKFIAKFSDLLHSVFQSKGCVIEIDSFTSGIDLIGSIEKQGKLFDVIFLDIEMPEISGIDVAKRLRQLPNQSFYLLFTTFMENEWGEGYVYKAFRFILKKRLEEDLLKAVDYLLAEMNNSENLNEVIDFKYNNTGFYDNISVHKNDILYLEKDKARRIWMYTTYGKYKLLVKALTNYETQINSKSFGIFVRNYLINMSKIENYEEDFFILTGKVKIPMGTSKETIKESKQRYMQYLSERI